MKNPKKRKRMPENVENLEKPQEEPAPKKSKKREKRNKPKKLNKEQRNDLVDDKKFNALINSYKNKINSAPAVAKKWFD